MEEHSQHFVGDVAQKAIIEKDGKILVCRGVGDSVWEFPGGRLHEGEKPKDGLAREIKEELGVDVWSGSQYISAAHSTASQNSGKSLLDMCVRLRKRT